MRWPCDETRLASIFGDPGLVTLADVAHSGDEERWFSIGFADKGYVLTVGLPETMVAIRNEIRRLRFEHRSWLKRPGSLARP